MAPRAAVVVRAPAHAPRIIAGWNLKRYLPARRPTIKGHVVTTMPAAKRPRPLDFKPLTNAGPALIPTTAMNPLSPTLLNTQRAGSGIRPKVRWIERNHPQNNPAKSAPPLVLKLSGTPPT